MTIRSEARTVGFGLLAAASSFGGMLAAIYGSIILLGSGYATTVLTTVVWLVFTFAIAPALATHAVVTAVARLLKGNERASFAAMSAFVGGAVAVAGSLLVNGLFLFVGWYLFPWTFAYAGMVFPTLLHRRTAGGGDVAIQVGVATAVYGPWIAVTLYNAFDHTAEMAGFREGAGWIENFPTAVVLLLLYGMVTWAALGAMGSRGVGRRRGYVAPTDQNLAP